MSLAEFGKYLSNCIAVCTRTNACGIIWQKSSVLSKMHFKMKYNHDSDIPTALVISRIVCLSSLNYYPVRKALFTIYFHATCVLLSL